MPRERFLRAAGPLRPAYERVDWSATALGAMSSWSPALRNAVDVALNTSFPVALLWGPSFVLVYNAAFVDLIADKHPSALGRGAREVFPEVWDTIGPLMEGVLAGDGPTWVEDAYVPLHRHGFLEEAYFTFSYSPVRGMDGTIEGVLDIATETTRHVIDHRRLETLNRLRDALGDVEHVSQIAERTLPLLRQNTADLPAVQLRYEEAAALRGGAGADDTGPASAIVESGAGGRRVRLPLGAAQDEGRRPMLIVQLSEHLAPDSSYIGFLRLIAASIGQALARVHAGEAEHGIAEAMQRSLLTRPSQPEDLQVAVRYQPAAEQLQVGGDWYDSFIGPDGSTTLVVGDVTGHDQWAAAAMAQVRNLLRGVAYTLSQSPARELAVLDRAMYGLGVGVYATALLARVDRDPDDPGGTTRRLRWSNAGHPPPVLLGRDGRARLLETVPDVLLGLGDAPRHDHAVALAPGDTVVLYTDGLVERRDSPIDARLKWLTDLLQGGQDADPEALCDRLLDAIDANVDDDVALLVLRVSERPADTVAPSEPAPGLDTATVDS